MVRAAAGCNTDRRARLSNRRLLLSTDTAEGAETRRGAREWAGRLDEQRSTYNFSQSCAPCALRKRWRRSILRWRVLWVIFMTSRQCSCQPSPSGCSCSRPWTDSVARSTRPNSRTNREAACCGGLSQTELAEHAAPDQGEHLIVQSFARRGRAPRRGPDRLRGAAYGKLLGHCVMLLTVPPASSRYASMPSQR